MGLGFGTLRWCYGQGIKSVGRAAYFQRQRSVDVSSLKNTLHFAAKYTLTPSNLACQSAGQLCALKTATASKCLFKRYCSQWTIESMDSGIESSIIALQKYCHPSLSEVCLINRNIPALPVVCFSAADIMEQLEEYWFVDPVA